MKPKDRNPKLILRDLLAIDRTRLSNERTFLSYFRSFIVIVSSGIAIMKIDMLSEIHDLGIAFIVLGPIMLFIGIGRFFYVRKHIRKLYDIE